MASATRSTPRDSSPRCWKAGFPTRRALPTLCQTRSGRRSPRRSISSTAAQARLHRPSAVATTTSDYVEQQLESDQGDQDVGVQLALYFQRVAPTVTSEYGILADPNLLQVAATIMGLPPTAAADLQPQTLSELMPHLRPAGPGQAQAADRAVHRDVRLYLRAQLRRDLRPHGRFRQFDLGQSGAAAVLASIISSNGSVLGSALNDFTGASQPIFSTALMSSMSRLHAGRVSPPPGPHSP